GFGVWPMPNVGDCARIAGLKPCATTAAVKTIRSPESPLALHRLALQTLAAQTMRITTRLCAVAIGDPSVRRNLPRLDAVVVILGVGPANLYQRAERRLCVTGVVGASRRDQRAAAVPLPRPAETRVRARQHRRLQL